MKPITRTVLILSLVSLFNDVASEMLYPVMPLYLKRIGFTVLLIGVLEGVAEAVSGISKGYFGRLSDVTGKRVTFVRLGYLCSALSKPLLGMLTWPLWVFGVRTLDRVGKGIRTGARDAMLSAEATPETKGRIFGFHRGMDSLGAVIGPASALIFLHYAPHQYRLLFFIAFVPGVVSVILLYTWLNTKAGVAIPQAPSVPIRQSDKRGLFSFLKYWKQSPALYRQLVAGLLVFTLFNSSDYFLLLKMSTAGLSDTLLIAIYILYNLVYATMSYPLGSLGDKLGLKYVLILGLLLFATVYAGMAYSTHTWMIVALFVIYGIYIAATDGVSKAWITNISCKEDSATAIGTFAALQSICTMIASSLAGLLWLSFGPKALFLSSALVTVGVAAYLLFVPKRAGE